MLNHRGRLVAPNSDNFVKKCYRETQGAGRQVQDGLYKSFGEIKTLFSGNRRVSRACWRIFVGRRVRHSVTREQKITNVCRKPSNIELPWAPSRRSGSYSEPPRPPAPALCARANPTRRPTAAQQTTQSRSSPPPHSG